MAAMHGSFCRKKKRKKEKKGKEKKYTSQQSTIILVGTYTNEDYLGSGAQRACVSEATTQRTKMNYIMCVRVCVNADCAIVIFLRLHPRSGMG